MIKLFTVKEMLALEKEADAAGLTYEMMMENAGKGVADEIELAYSQLPVKKVIALVGSGNNGGDALVALYYLVLNGWNTTAYIVRKRAEDDPLINRLHSSGGEILNIEDDINYTHLAELMNSCAVLIDGIFGTGITLPLKGEIVKVLKFVNKRLEQIGRMIHIVAVDCPSGVDCENGEAADETIPAQMTITMAGVKAGLLRFPAARYTGELRIASIGPIYDLTTYSKNKKYVLSPDLIKDYLPLRPSDAHKGTFGTALVIAGSINYTGAALLSGMAAYRAGTGLVTMAVPAPLHEVLAGHMPEATWLLLPHEMGVISAEAARIVRQNQSHTTSILIGPGFGLEDTTREFLARLLLKTGVEKTGEIGFIHAGITKKENNPDQKAMVVDADGLKLLSKLEKWSDLLPKLSVLTPHPGEMSVITGLTTEEIQANRIEIASRFSKKWGHVVVLKGAFTIIAAPDGHIAVVPVASSALARAGTGDVLAGLIVGFRAQGVEAFQAACLGAWIHASAGLLAAKRMGNTASVIASDVLAAVPQIITELVSE